MVFCVGDGENKKSSPDGLIDDNPTTNLQQPRDFFYTHTKRKEKKKEEKEIDF